MRWSSQRKPRVQVQQDGVIEIPSLLREHVAAFFDDLYRQMTTVMLNVEQQLAQYRGQVPQEQLLAVMQQQFEEHLESYQAEQLRKLDCSEAELERAVDYYREDADIHQGVARLRRMHASVSGQSAQKLPRNLTEERFCEALQVYFDVSSQEMQKLVAEMQAQGRTLGAPGDMQYLLKEFGTRQEAAATSVLQPYELDSELIGPALDKFKNSPAVMAKFAECQQRQQEEFGRLGL